MKREYEGPRRYDFFNGKNGMGFDCVEDEHGEWVRADDFDALDARNKDLEKTIDRLLLLQRLGHSVDVKEIPDAS